MKKAIPLKFFNLLSRWKALWLLGFFLPLTFGDVSAQTADFSQYFNNPLYYNPANTGSELGFKARMNFKNQFNRLGDNYDNISFSMDFAERAIPGSGGIGLLFLSDFDGIGLVRTTAVKLTYSARIQITDRLITQLGIGPAFVTRSIDWSQLVFSDQLDPHYGAINPSVFQSPDRNSISHPDLGIGFLFQYFGNSRNYSNIVTSIGGSVDHVLSPDISFSGIEHRMPLKYLFSANILFDNSRFTGAGFARQRSEFRFNPGFVYMQHENLRSLLAGLNAYKNHIYTGIWGRAQQYEDATVTDVILLLGVDIPLGDQSGLKIMYSYDYLVGGLMRSTGPTHEISLVYELNNFSIFGIPGRRLNPLECPIW